jgi:Ca-activated chloride channel family protein
VRHDFLDRVADGLSQLLEPAFSAVGVEALESPGRLPWILLLTFLCGIVAMRRHRRAVSWPGIPEIQKAGGRRTELIPAVAGVLRLAALFLLALVVARPVVVDQAPPEPGRGLDLILVLDTSASMRALDTSMATPSRLDVRDAFSQTRLDLAKRVVSRFARSRVEEGDRVGLVVFGSSAFTQCPLTSDGALLAEALKRTDVGIAGDATALGDALALAVKRVPANSNGLGQVIVLLSDGRSNAGSIPVEIAIELARAAELRVHTVGIGTGGAEVPMARRASRGDQALRFERHDTDPETLERIAVATGGRSFLATRPDELEAIYREIDALERTERALPARRRRTLYAEPLLAGAGGLVVLEIVFAQILRRRTT